MRILLADDDPLVASTLRRMCQLSGATIVGEEDTAMGCVQTAVRERPDLIFLDAGMDSGAALIVLPRLRAMGFQVVVTSGDPANEAVARQHRIPFLCKPFGLEQVTGLISQSTNRASESAG